jgi:hypothetical protein
MPSHPVIISLTPNNGPIGTGVIINGSGFIDLIFPQTPVVTFNGVSAVVLSASQTQIYTQVPVGATTGNVVVNNGSSSSNGVLFTVSASGPAPTISSLTPNSGPTGTTVIIAGTNFGSSQNTSTVTFNGIAASVSSWSSTSITASVPATASTGNVVVTVGGVASNGLLFTVTTPSNGGTAQPLNLFLILGMNFLTPAIWTLDPTNFDDAGMGGFYFWKEEDVIAGRTPTVSRVIISYRNLGVATFTLNLAGTDDSGATVSNSTPVSVGTASATGRICSKVVGLALTGQNLQVSVSRVPGSGPLSITKVRLEGRVETTVY